MGILFLKRITPHISNQTSQRCWKLFRGMEIASLHFWYCLFLLFKLHLPELHDLLKHLHKTDDLSGMLHGVETRSRLWWCSQASPRRREMASKGGRRQQYPQVGFQLYNSSAIWILWKVKSYGQAKKKKSLLKSSPSGKNKKTRKVAPFTVQTRA